jgi:hypothetical protein
VKRRAWLRGVGGIAVALPWLESWPRRANAEGDAFPTRCVLVFSSNGTVPPSWTPGPDFTLSPILAPLSDHRDRIIVCSGIDMLSSGGDHKGHNRGVGALWTGLEPFGGNDGDSGYAGGISIDQFLAQALQPGTPFSTLEFGVRVKSDLPNGRMIYSGPNQPIAPQDNPFAMFDRLFGEGTGGADAAAALLARRQSVLDAVADDTASILPQLGGADRVKLQAHLDAVRSLEQRLAALGGLGCTAPELPAQFDWKQNDRYPEVGELQLDLLVMALACGLTRIASLMWSHALSSVIFTWLGQSVDHHTLSHDESPPAQEQLVAIGSWYAERFAGLLDRMAAVVEGDGTLLDHSVVVWGSELGKGQPHYCTQIPFVLAGSCNGYFATGRHLAFDHASHNDLLLAVLEAMGVVVPSFGDPAFCHGPLPELRG